MQVSGAVTQARQKTDGWKQVQHNVWRVLAGVRCCVSCIAAAGNKLINTQSGSISSLAAHHPSPPEREPSFLTSFPTPSHLLFRTSPTPCPGSSTIDTATDSTPSRPPSSSQSVSVRRNVTAVSTSVKLSAPNSPSHGPSASNLGLPPSSSNCSRRLAVDDSLLVADTVAITGDSHDSSETACDDPLKQDPGPDSEDTRQLSPPPQYPASEASASTAASLVSYRTAPPPFSSLYATTFASLQQPDPTAVATPRFDLDATSPESSTAPAYEPPAASGSSDPESAYQQTLADTKRALPQDTKAEGSSRAKDDDAEPPPAYSEEAYSPLHSFSYVMAAAGGASSIITQVQQGGPPINTIGGKGCQDSPPG